MIEPRRRLRHIRARAQDAEAENRGTEHAAQMNAHRLAVSPSRSTRQLMNLAARLRLATRNATGPDRPIVGGHESDRDRDAVVR